MKAPSYKREKPQKRYDAILIGSGIGALAAAYLLADKGKSVLILERHYALGGFTHVFKRKRFEWDVGVHYIGEVGNERSVLHQIFKKLSGGKLHWADMGDIYDRVIIQDDVYDFPKGREAFREAMKSYFPEEGKVIDEYIDLIYQTARASGDYFAERALPGLASALAGPMMRRKFLRHAERSTLEVLQELGASPRLIAVLTAQYGDYGLPPAQSSFAMHAMVVKHYFKGGFYPVGGSGSIPDTIIEQIVEKGGEIYSNAEVAEIMIQGNKATGVKMSDGYEIQADMVISNAGAYNTFGKLLPKSHQDQTVLDKLGAIGLSASHACLYVGLNKSDEELNTPRHNYWIYPGYDHDESLSRYLKDAEADLPVAYISFPSAKDPAFSEKYPGRSTVEIVTLARWDQYLNWENTGWHKRGDDYETFKKETADRMLKILFSVEPQLEAHVEVAELSTPLSTKHFMNYERGEIYGLAHNPARFKEKLLRPRTSIKNLWLCGQDVVSAGVGGALMGGVLCASAIERKNLVKEMLQV